MSKSKIYGEICKIEGCIKKRYSRNSTCGMHKTRYERYGAYDLPIKVRRYLPEGIVKDCKIHGHLTEEKIYFNTSNGKHWPQCKECRKSSNYIYQERNPSRHRTVIFAKKYNELFEKQDGKCAICKKPETSKSTNSKRNKETKRLALDHCHLSEENGIIKIRGLLCHHCNTGLGHFDDSIETLETAIAYLKLHQSPK